MNKVIDHRLYNGKKVICVKAFDYTKQTECVGYMPFIRGGGCTFKCSGNICRRNDFIPEERTIMVYIVGRLEPYGDKVLLEVDGVFNDYNRAVKVCKTPKHFIGPVPLNKTLPAEGIAWPGMHYPNRRAE